MQAVDELISAFSPELDRNRIEQPVQVADAALDEDDEEDTATKVSSLTAILLDTSEALAAAQRLYENTQSGLRFFSDFRRVVPTSQLRAEMIHEAHEEDDLEANESH